MKWLIAICRLLIALSGRRFLAQRIERHIEKKLVTAAMLKRSRIDSAATPTSLRLLESNCFGSCTRAKLSLNPPQFHFANYRRFH